MEVYTLVCLLNNLCLVGGDMHCVLDKEKGASTKSIQDFLEGVVMYYVVVIVPRLVGRVGPE